MLVLSRKRHQSIRIGDQIEVTVVHISGNSVRLGIVAPSDVPVHRREIAERIASQTHPAPPCCDGG